MGTPEITLAVNEAKEGMRTKPTVKYHEFETKIRQLEAVVDAVANKTGVLIGEFRFNSNDSHQPDVESLPVSIYFTPCAQAIYIVSERPAFLVKECRLGPTQVVNWGNYATVRQNLTGTFFLTSACIRRNEQILAAITASYEALTGLPVEEEVVTK